MNKENQMESAKISNNKMTNKCLSIKCPISFTRASSSLSLTWASCLACRTISWASPTLLNSLSVTVRIVSTASSWDSPAYNTNTAHTNKTQVKFPNNVHKVINFRSKLVKFPDFILYFNTSLYHVFLQAETITFITVFFGGKKFDEIFLNDNIFKSYMFPIFFNAHYVHRKWITLCT